MLWELVDLEAHLPNTRVLTGTCQLKGPNRDNPSLFQNLIKYVALSAK
jgi:hypothetical protein